ncbi:MAG: HIT domain-containing protein [Candidatus Eisenbacteria bacterium]
MRIISAGWRMAYVGKGSGKNCIFCGRTRSGTDRKNFIVLRGEHAFVMMNRFPYTTGHLMVAPYRHVSSLARLTPEEACEIMGLLAECEALLTKAIGPQGFNFGINMGRCAGAGFPGHVHVHVVPRWEGDTNFMPVVSESKVLPETLTDTYRKLMKAGSVPGKTGRPKRAPRGRSPSRGKR